tara:strand:- start:51 stop:458 length:408 start_codon:yes stop_codon:yes gene_type:complete
MGVYINKSCPNCKVSLSDGYRRTKIPDFLGLPKITCWKCNTIINTGLKPYSKFSYFGKFYFWIAATITSLIQGLLAGMMFYLPCLLINSDWAVANIKYLFFTGLLIGFVWQFRIYVINIKWVEEEFKNKGESMKL